MIELQIPALFLLGMLAGAGMLGIAVGWYLKKR